MRGQRGHAGTLGTTARAGSRSHARLLSGLWVLLLHVVSMALLVPDAALALSLTHKPHVHGAKLGKSSQAGSNKQQKQQKQSSAPTAPTVPMALGAGQADDMLVATSANMKAASTVNADMQAQATMMDAPMVDDVSDISNDGFSEDGVYIPMVDGALSYSSAYQENVPQLPTVERDGFAVVSDGELARVQLGDCAKHCACNARESCCADKWNKWCTKHAKSKKCFDECNEGVATVIENGEMRRIKVHSGDDVSSKDTMQAFWDGAGGPGMPNAAASMCAKRCSCKKDTRCCPESIDQKDIAMCKEHQVKCANHCPSVLDTFVPGEGPKGVEADQVNFSNFDPELCTKACACEVDEDHCCHEMWELSCDTHKNSVQCSNRCSGDPVLKAMSYANKDKGLSFYDDFVEEECGPKSAGEGGLDPTLILPRFRSLQSTDDGDEDGIPDEDIAQNAEIWRVACEQRNALRRKRKKHKSEFHYPADPLASVTHRTLPEPRTLTDPSLSEETSELFTQRQHHKRRRRRRKPKDYDDW